MMNLHIRRTATFCLPLALLSGCSTDTDPADTEAEVLDLRMSFPEAPNPGIQYVTEEMVIPPHIEMQWCFFFQYDGEDIGISKAFGYQPENGHHVILMETEADEDDFPNGTSFDCTDRETLPMTDMRPIYIPANAETDALAQSEMNLPEGMAVKLSQGTRLVVQSHYINPLDNPIRVQDAVNFAFVPLTEDTIYAASISHTSTDLPLLPNVETKLTVDCGFSDDINVLYLLGHMHEWGKSFSTDLLKIDGTSERIYTIDEWRPEYRDVAPVIAYEPGEFFIPAGSRFLTTCNWYNDTDQEINFPQEMCVTAGMVYPSIVPLVCDVAD